MFLILYGQSFMAANGETNNLAIWSHWTADEADPKIRFVTPQKSVESNYEHKKLKAEGVSCFTL